MAIVHLIGGGPSAADLDTSRMRGLRIGINDAAFHKPCDWFFSNDHGYALDIRERLHGFKGQIHLAIRQRFIHRFADWPVTIWTRRDEKHPIMREGELSSGPAGTPGCSGYVALNLAAQFGATTIVLYGYDFEDDYRYFFAGTYPRVRIPEVRESFRNVAPWYRRQGINVFNANPSSQIDAFPRITHKEAFSLDENRNRHHDRQAGAR